MRDLLNHVSARTFCFQDGLDCSHDFGPGLDRLNGNAKLIEVQEIVGYQDGLNSLNQDELLLDDSRQVLRDFEESFRGY